MYQLSACHSSLVLFLTFWAYMPTILWHNFQGREENVSCLFLCRFSSRAYGGPVLCTARQTHVAAQPPALCPPTNTRQFISACGRRILEATSTTGQPTTTYICQVGAVNYKTPVYCNLEAISPQLDPKTVCSYCTSNKTIEMFREVGNKERMVLTNNG